MFPSSSKRAFAAAVKTALVNRYAVFGAALYAYSLAMERLGGLAAPAFFSQWLELGLVFYLYYVFNRLLRPSPWQALLAALPVFLAYLAYDAYYLMYGKVFRFAELTEVPELVQVLPASMLAVLFAVFGAPLLLVGASIGRSRPRTLFALFAPALALGAFVTWHPIGFAGLIDRFGNEVVFYSDAKSAENNGRLSMALYREAQRRIALRMTEPLRDRATYEHDAAVFAQKLAVRAKRRNVHLIVLESFLDPALFRKARFSRGPAHPDFERMFGKKPGLSISPVFGGATAQAEFEVLCGVPAFENLSGVEFNAFTGAQAYCMPGILSQIGYRSVASNAYRPNFFNAGPAYRGMGFGEAHFPRQYAPGEESYLDIGDVEGEGFMFDEQLFEQNLAFVAGALKEDASRPLLNYVLTVYGHTPHDINSDKRPQVLQVISDYPDDHLQRAANQYYYRTQAIARYVKRLVAIDRRSLIILVSDHVPPLRNGLNTYRELAYMDNIENSYRYNRVLVIQDGKPVHYDIMHHYDVPGLVYNYLTGGRYCREAGCGFLKGGKRASRESYLGRYMSIMAHASE